MGFCQLKDSDLPRIDHRTIVSFHLQRVSNNGERLDQIELTLAHLQTLQEVRLLKDFLLILQGEDGHLLRTWLLAQLHLLEHFSKLILNCLEILNSDSLQSQSLLMVFSSDCSNTQSLSGFILVQLTDSDSLGDDVQLIHEPFDP